MKAKTFRAWRRSVLKAAVSLAGGALLTCALDAAAQQIPKFKPKPAPKKHSKEKVGYRDEPYEGRSCAKCVLYQGHGECVIVEGEVSPEGWCVHWTPATMGQRGGLPTA
jgi:High potential iron-sulfur protein